MLAEPEAAVEIAHGTTAESEASESTNPPSPPELDSDGGQPHLDPKNEKGEFDF